jgi:hypothetical protein
MKEFNWADFTEEGHIQASSGARDTLFTWKLKLDGGREYQVSELILRASDILVPGVEIKVDVADRALQLHGMKVKEDTLLIARPHPQIKDIFAKTEHGTNPYTELLTVPGSIGKWKPTTKFAGTKKHYICLPLADLLADAPAAAEGEDLPF